MCPMILVISLILSNTINSKIKFRTGFRLIFFFPVVVISGPVMTQLRSSNTMQLMDISELLIFRMIDNISPFFSNILMSIFDNFTLILWFTGIPIILFFKWVYKKLIIKVYMKQHKSMVLIHGKCYGRLCYQI